MSKKKKSKQQKSVSNNLKSTSFSKIGKNELYALISSISKKPKTYSISQIEEILIKKSGAKSLIEYIDLTNQSGEFTVYADTYDFISNAMEKLGYISNISNTFYQKQKKWYNEVARYIWRASYFLIPRDM